MNRHPERRVVGDFTLLPRQAEVKRERDDHRVVRRPGSRQRDREAATRLHPIIEADARHRSVVDDDGHGREVGVQEGRMAIDQIQSTTRGRRAPPGQRKVQDGVAVHPRRGDVVVAERLERCRVSECAGRRSDPDRWGRGGERRRDGCRGALLSERADRASEGDHDQQDEGGGRGLCVAGTAMTRESHVGFPRRCTHTSVKSSGRGPPALAIVTNRSRSWWASRTPPHWAAISAGSFNRRSGRASGRPSL